jgi:hypothetical protein
VLVALPASSAGSNGSFFVGFTDDLVKNEGSPAVPPADDRRTGTEITSTV